jgi:drug/metabolite transporter (DMT)-like permease
MSTYWLVLISFFHQVSLISFLLIFAALSGALTASLVLTLRKFVSLLFSIVIFAHPFTTLHWAGTALVFGGSLAYSHLNCGAQAPVVSDPPPAVAPVDAKSTSDHQQQTRPKLE